MGISTAVLPYLNAAQATHPAYQQSLERLRRTAAAGRKCWICLPQAVRPAVISAAVLAAVAESGRRLLHGPERWGAVLCCGPVRRGLVRWVPALR
jgi:hypothetical protein